MKIKCPACKSPISFQLGAAGDISCAQCHSRFERKIIEAAVSRRLQQIRQSNSAAEKPAPPKSPAADTATTSAASVKPTEAKLPGETSPPTGKSPAEPNSPIESASPTDSISIVTSAQNNSPTEAIPTEEEFAGVSPSHLATVSRRKKRRSWILVALVLVCIGMTCALFIVYRNNISSARSNDANDTVNIETADGAADDAANAELPSIETEEPEIDWGPIVFGLIDNQTENDEYTFAAVRNRFKPKKAVDDAWFLLQPYLVELHAESPSGPSFATGTIIDSRGWVLTSYSAVQGAATIHVRSARKNKDDTSERIVDTVRGYIAVDESLDLAILSVNRRLVDTFEDLTIATEDNLFASQYVVQCQSPSLVFPQQAVESRVLSRGKFSTLAELDSERLERQNVATEVEWIHHQQNSPLVSGAILMGDTGNMIGMNTGFRTGREHHIIAVPSTEIAKFTATAETDAEKIQDLPIGGAADPSIALLSAGGTSAPDNDGSQTQDSPPEGSLLGPVQRLNRFGNECELFGWKSQNEIDDKSFRNFVKAYVELSNSDTEDAQAANAVGDQLDGWQQKLAAAFGTAADWTLEQQASFNRKFAAVQHDSEQPFIGFARVKYSVTECPRIAIGGDDPQESVVFEFKGTDMAIVTNHSSQWRPMPPDSPWLLIGYGAGGVVRLQSQSGQLEKLELAFVKTTFQSD